MHEQAAEMEMAACLTLGGDPDGDASKAPAGAGARQASASSKNDSASASLLHAISKASFQLVRKLKGASERKPIRKIARCCPPGGYLRPEADAALRRAPCPAVIPVPFPRYSQASHHNEAAFFGRLKKRRMDDSSSAYSHFVRIHDCQALGWSWSACRRLLATCSSRCPSIACAW